MERANIKSIIIEYEELAGKMKDAKDYNSFDNKSQSGSSHKQ